MNGLIVVNKEINRTSRDIVNDLTKILGTKKIGHTGTLDPLATGVLVCLVGRYTKLNELLTATTKKYEAEIKLGIETDTGDITGKVTMKKSFSVTEEQIKKVLDSMMGSYEQEVPLYSAVKIKGKKLYEYAREGKTVTLPKRMVTIYTINLIEYHDDVIKFDVEVSKGTYIRSLIKDICTKLGTVGTMQSLVRLKQGPFTLDEAYSLKEIAAGNYKCQNIKDFWTYPIVEIPDELLNLVTNGALLKNTWEIKDKVLLTYQGRDLAIYEKDKQELKQYLKL